MIADRFHQDIFSARSMIRPEARVAMVSDWFLPRLGGIELHIADLSLELIAAGCEVEIHSTVPGPALVNGLTVHRTPALLAHRFGFAISPRLVNLIKRELSQGNYDVLHAHLSIISPLSFAAIFAARQLGLPTVATFHSVLGATRLALRVTDCLSGWSRWPLALTAVSKLVADELRGALPNADVSVLPNGVDVAYWKSVSNRTAGDDILVVAAMRLEPRKRPIALLEAFKAAREQVNARARRIRLVVAGAGSQRWRMERFIAKNGLSPDVTLLGAQPREKLRELYAGADVFVLPSIREAFGIAALEARCAGLPVVAMYDAGPAEFLHDGETALLAADDQELGRALGRVALDDNLRAKLSRTDQSVERYAWPAVVAAHQACYARVRKR